MGKSGGRLLSQARARLRAVALEIAAPNRENRLRPIPRDRKPGETLWQQVVPCDVEETTHPQNPPCSASPVTDGKVVYANFASGGVLACTLDGKRLWHRDLGPVLSKWGNGGSPILHGKLL